MYVVYEAAQARSVHGDAVEQHQALYAYTVANLAADYNQFRHDQAGRSDDPDTPDSEPYDHWSELNAEQRSRLVQYADDHIGRHGNVIEAMDQAVRSSFQHADEASENETS